MDWRASGACLDKDPELFFPIGSSDIAYQQIEAAKQICGGCKVKEPCLAWALAMGNLQGVWGGMNETERAAHRRRVARASAANRSVPV